MRKIILFMSISIDGYMEGPNRDIDWHLVDEEVHSEFNRYIASMGGFLSGRVTYELMAGFWPQADKEPGAPAAMVEFAPIWRDTPKIVYSRTLQHAAWNTTIVRDVVPDEVRALKAQPGADLLLGGANLAETFLRHDLIDEFRLYLHPWILGEGHRVFPELQDRRRLELAESHTFANGVVLVHHKRPTA